MGFFDHLFPYTNFHELNLDWILRKLKLFEKEVEKIPQYVEEYCAENNTHAGIIGNPHKTTAADVGAAPAIESADFPGCYYRTVNGKTEWINPPFELGVEYLTTERWNDKAKFAKLLDLGSLPANSTATYDVALSTATKVHSMELLAVTSSYKYIPLAYESGITSAFFNRGSAKVVITTNTTYADIVNVYLKVKYTDNR